MFRDPSGLEPRACSRVLSIVTVASSLLASDLAIAQEPQWIWDGGERVRKQTITLRSTFAAGRDAQPAQLTLFADFCHVTVSLNGVEVAAESAYGPPLRVDLTALVKSTTNTIEILCQGVEGPSAVAGALDVEDGSGNSIRRVTDGSWQVRSMPNSTAGEDAVWRPATVYGRMAADAGYSLSNPVRVDLRDDYTQWKRALTDDRATEPSTFRTLDGFQVRLVKSATSDEDSWVSMARDPSARWIIGKEKRGLLRLTLDDAGGSVVKTELINDSLAECRGLVWAHGSLYAMANEDKALFRLRDTVGDDRFDRVERVADFSGDSGHGRNQITLGPDGMIYAILGDAVFEPATASSLVPKLSNPSRTETTRSGFVARTDKDGREWQVVTRGLRNPFGIAFNRDGDMFTYDADAEYDMGSSWYRPTRVHHIAVGGDYGWRRVTRQWPPYFPDRADMPQPLLDIGKGSPTSVAFGYGSSFPWPYRDALFVLDWAYGRILAVHLSPRGSSYAARAETFLRGAPLNVTDLEFGEDGAMYFVTGGRATQSALYRVSYVGPQTEHPSPTRHQTARHEHAVQSRALRDRLESYFGKVQSGAIDAAWPHLSSNDPWIRYAARTVIEWQPVDGWRFRALNSKDFDTTLAALLALVRVGEMTDRPAILDRLSEFDLRQLTIRQLDEAVFLHQRCLEGEVASRKRSQAAKRLDAVYPSSSSLVNRRLSVLLSEFNSPRFVDRTLTLLRNSESQADRLHYLFVLRHAADGWTREWREVYFEHLKQTSEYVGGEGMPRFRELIETESLATLAPNERDRFTRLLRTNALDDWQLQHGHERREFVRRWTVDDFAIRQSGANHNANMERGRRLFSVVQCVICHRVGREGGVVGPDLTAVSARFSPRDLLTSILEPSKVVAEKYQGATFVLKDGRVVTGQPLATDFRSDTLTVVTDALAHDKQVAIPKSLIESQLPSAKSPMPQGLLDTLTKEEILDLLAWLLAGGRGG